MAEEKSFEDAREFWDTRFDTETFIFGTEPNVFLASNKALFKPGMRVLAVADGEGRNGVWLAQHGCEVLSVDVSPIAIEKARKLATERGVQVQFECANLMEWDWPQQSFDAVVCIFIQFATPAERKTLFDGFWSALKPGGVVLLQGYGVKQLQYTSGGPGKLEHLYTPDMLREAFSRWQIDTLTEYEAVLDEGPRHSGMAALVDLIARKPLTDDR
jgi:cyclopropane fatty-acyl-phospholipid synthase-like methyltransferase